MWACRKCGFENYENSNTCQKCGRPRYKRSEDDFSAKTAIILTSILVISVTFLWGVSQIIRKSIIPNESELYYEYATPASMPTLAPTRAPSPMPTMPSVTMAPLQTPSPTINPEDKYAEAIKLLGEGNRTRAFSIFQSLGDFLDAKKQMQLIWATPIAAGGNHTVRLLKNGRVLAAGDNTNNQCDVGNWTDVVSVAASDYDSFGLKADGTVLFTGEKSSSQYDISNWTDIVAIATGDGNVFGLRADGSIITSGYMTNNDLRIIGLAVGSNHTVGLLSDGSVLATGNNGYGQCDVSGWTDIIAIAAGSNYTVGLKSNGTVLATGSNGYGQCDVSGWTDIIAIAAGSNYTVGLKSNGTGLATGYNGYGQCNVSGWTDIIAIAVGSNHTVGLKSDGTVLATGGNGYGQCEIDKMSSAYIEDSGKSVETVLKELNAPRLTISNMNTFPEKIWVGGVAELSGTIETNKGIITKVWAGIISDTGGEKQSCHFEPRRSSFSLDKTVNLKLKFGDLQPGNYIYKVSAIASNGNYSSGEVELLSFPFEIYVP